ncbi:MAG: tetratricopeptide repeat protein, partial [Candidatus Obscuribacterales bacterium]|nr:tetratricopeptide repeat protein [Candidatus Obscuribacterales bacterium]
TDGSGAARAQLQQISKQAQSSFEQAKKFQKEGNLKEAEKFYLHSLKVRETYWKAIDPIIPEIYDALASIYAENGKTDQSEKALKEMLASYARLHGPGSKHRIKPLKALGDIYASANELWDSHDHYEQALVLSERYDGADSPQALELRLLVAGKLKDLGKSDRAADLFEKSLKLNNDKDYLTNDQIVETLDSYAVVLKKLNKTKEAENMQNQANQLRADGKTPTLEDSVEKVPADDKGASIKKTTDVE